MSLAPERGKHILWLSFPSIGHIKQTLGVVEELGRRGHRVTYSVADRLAGRVEDTGARLLPYRSVFPESIDSTEGVEDMTLEFIRESFAPLESALELTAGDPPDLIVHDALGSDTAAILSRMFEVPTARIYAGFGTNEQVPLNGTETGPDDEPFDQDFQALAELGDLLTRRIAELGVAEFAGEGLASGDEAVLNISHVTREFQIKGETFDDDYAFVGPCLRESDFAGTWAPPAGAPPTLLISLGTTVNLRPEFFRTCARAFAGLPWHVVMTLGRNADPGELGELPPNVEVHQWVPHLAVLEHAAAFVCQGGTGSLMEAFYSGVPVVVVPQQSDQHAIARQVADLGIGLALDPAKFTAEALVAAVTGVAASAAIRQRAVEMGRHVRAAGGAATAADRLEACLA